MASEDVPAWLVNYCNSSFWNDQLIYTDSPEFTNCFRETALVWGPCLLVWIFGLLQLFTLIRNRRAALQISTLHVLKLVSTMCIFITMIVEMSYNVSRMSDVGDQFLQADVATPAIFAITMIFVAILQHTYRFTGRVTSGLLCVFWFSLMICQLLTLVSIDSKVSENGTGDLLNFVTFHIFYFFVVASFLFSCFGEPKRKSHKNDCPELYTSYLNRILFWWFNPVVWHGFRKPLVREDLWKLNKRDETSVAAPKLIGNWEIELEKAEMTNLSSKKQDAVVFANAGVDAVVIESQKSSYSLETKKTPSLVKAMIKTYGFTMLAAAFYKLGQDTIQFISPILLSRMITFTSDTSISEWVGYMYAIAMYLVAVIQAIFLNQYFHRCMLVGMNMRTGIISLVYKKALRISNEARRESTVGEIVNLMSTDAQRFMDLMSYIQILWSGPYTMAVALWLLWLELGPSVMAGFAFMILLIPINGFITAKLRTYSIKNMKLKDQRIKSMNEILNGIKVLKLYAWEESSENQIAEIRDEEIKLARKTAYLRALMMFLWTVAPFMVAFITFCVYVSVSPYNILTSDKAFVSISLFNILRFPLIMLPAMISGIVQVQVSVKRITKFLTSREIDIAAVDRSNSDSEDVIEVNNGTFSWDLDSENCLKQINMSVKRGSLVAIVGHVGCGKSSLISALLGEMEKKEGLVRVSGSIAYVPQTAWIQNCTLQDNILFGKSLSGKEKKENQILQNGHSRIIEETRYNSIIASTALGPDLKVLPGGDQTEIGEKGINLSGGQKQRISLARAVCDDADIYLLDDPLSAVDSHIGKHIFEKVISKNGLLKHKTRVLVTHGLQYLPEVDDIFVVHEGKISERGSYEELLKSGERFAKFLEEYANSKNEEESDDDDSESEDDDAKEEDNEVLSIKRLNSSSEKDERAQSIKRRSTRKKKRGSSKKTSASVKKDNRSKLTEEESVEKGQVSFKVYLDYIKSVGVTFSIGILFACILYQLAYVGASSWLSYWTLANDQAVANGSNNSDASAVSVELGLGVYAAFGIAQAIFVYGNGLIQARGTIQAARGLHYDMLRNIFRVPVQFFDTTPLGRIVNRFSKDTYIIDELLPQTIRMWLSCFFSVLATLIVIIYSTPWFAVVIIPIGILYYFAQKFYVATSRQLKRLESVTRSPIYSNFGETVSGVSVIRAFGRSESFILQCEATVDRNQECYYPNIVSNRWLSVRLEFVGNAIVFFAALFAVLSRGDISGALAGLSLSYALTITSTLNWWVRQMSELETNVVAVERVREYANTKNEADWENPANKPNKSWPENGVVEFAKYGTRYRADLDLVLKNISCTFNAGEKIGIVGRTGAGKSSLTLALFRLIEPANGQIKIDGVDVSAIGLHDLRKKLTIIPQDPVLFSGTLRINIDPFNAYPDDAIWSSLEHAHLKEYVSTLPDKLEHICTEGGENLSVGQRQLVCLARALLRKSKVLVLDEATAAVDLQTDDLIQQTIRSEFRECTVITIAHRLNTIMDYDKVVVLDKGEIVEIDSPDNLIQKRGTFFGMVKDAGLV